MGSKPNGLSCWIKLDYDFYAKSFVSNLSTKQEVAGPMVMILGINHEAQRYNNVDGSQEDNYGSMKPSHDKNEMQS